MRIISSPYRRDRVLGGLLQGAALLTGATLLLILVTTAIGAWPALPALGEALGSSYWAPLAGGFGMAAMIAASLAISLLALAIAAPLAVILAAWLQLYAPRRLAGPLRALYELLAGIPSVVYGLWGLIALVPLVNRIAPPGAALVTAALVLALMILPYGLLIADSNLRQVPTAQRQAALAMGLSRWAGFRAVYWPLAHCGVLRGTVLQFGRALGETMAVLMVAGNVVQVPDSLFAPVRALTANIALEMGYAGSDHRAVLYLSGLVLLGITLLVMALFRERGR